LVAGSSPAGVANVFNDLAVYWAKVGKSLILLDFGPACHAGAVTKSGTMGIRGDWCLRRTAGRFAAAWGG
jgi:hypothetical protein